MAPTLAVPGLLAHIPVIRLYQYVITNMITYRKLDTVNNFTSDLLSLRNLEPELLQNESINIGFSLITLMVKEIINDYRKPISRQICFCSLSI